ncbi:hypothetical protein L195_g017114 [Trifolium pratense]|uniref:Uncharacterized protein n=1 Tax=Trifolium pratense TaxID=57577 RepID=A0A2K3MTB4_TRIPR|nr:hypothetical protein L195_g017114 [Trifolium pratense]
MVSRNKFTLLGKLPHEAHAAKRERRDKLVAEVCCAMRMGHGSEDL